MNYPIMAVAASPPGRTGHVPTAPAFADRQNGEAGFGVDSCMQKSRSRGYLNVARPVRVPAAANSGRQIGLQPAGKTAL